MEIYGKPIGNVWERILKISTQDFVDQKELFSFKALNLGGAKEPEMVAISLLKKGAFFKEAQEIPKIR